MKKCASFFGFNLVITEKDKQHSEYSYESVLPVATYAPWLTDLRFQDTFARIRSHTFVDMYLCYELWQLVKESSKLSGALLEVGTWRGGSGALIAKRARLSAIRDTVYLCDSFQGVVKITDKDSRYVGGEHSNASKKIVENLVEKLDLENVEVLAGIFPEETSALIVDTQFRFCHIDVDVYESAKDVVAWVWPKLVMGGMIVFDDYGYQGCDGVTRFVNEQRDKKDRIVIHNLNGHAILVKVSA